MTASRQLKSQLKRNKDLNHVLTHERIVGIRRWRHKTFQFGMIWWRLALYKVRIRFNRCTSNKKQCSINGSQALDCQCRMSGDAETVPIKPKCSQSCDRDSTKTCQKMWLCHPSSSKDVWVLGAAQEHLLWKKHKLSRLNRLLWEFKSNSWTGAPVNNVKTQSPSARSLLLQRLWLNVAVSLNPNKSNKAKLI